MTLFDMKGKVAVITGSTRGIGLAIAERMAEHGAKVVISSRKADVCEEVAKGINDKFGKGTAVAIAALMVPPWATAMTSCPPASLLIRSMVRRVRL